MQSFAKHMPQVQEYLRRLDALQETWGNLALLSQMTGGGTDLADTRRAFESLSRELVQQLTTETLRKTTADLAARAQVAIDVLVRNLFERTADIGFLSLDDDIVRFARDYGGEAGDAPDVAALRNRFREYAAKYSVYSNVALLATDGRVLAQLDPAPLVRTTDALVGRTLSTTAAYTETFGATDLAGGAAVLVYAYRVQEQARTLAVLALCFRFEDEMRGIFAKLRAAEDDWAVLVLLDAQQRVIASSDPWQLPLGAPLPVETGPDGGIVRFAGRQYLAASRAASGYQGYLGPQGWRVQVMLPLEHAFEPRAAASANPATQHVAASHYAHIFSAELRAIPLQADRIRRDLGRAVWNGNLRRTTATEGQNFSGVLLQEISATGSRTQDLFARSIGNLQETVMSSLLEDNRFRASLAADILDRNLYERANDCRWWALNGTLASCLEGKVPAEAATRVLQQINALYTVYDHILLFDRGCRVVAVSRPDREASLGHPLTGEWARATMQLRGTQDWAVSRFEPYEHHGELPTWVFTAAVRGADGELKGGIAIVFDTVAQIEAMLRDVLPAGADAVVANDCQALFIDGDARVLASTGPHARGECLALPPHLVNPDPGGAADIVAFADGHYAVGSRRCAGYREFPGLAVTAILLRRLGEPALAAIAAPPQQIGDQVSDAGADAVRVATFACGGQWFAVPATQVVEAMEGDRITRMPGTSDWYPGVVRFQQDMIPVIDLARWNGNARRSDARTIIVVAEQAARMGLLIDQLGEVVETGAEDIVPVEVGAETTRAGAVSRVVKFGDPQAPALPLVDLDSLLSLLQ